MTAARTPTLLVIECSPRGDGSTTHVIGRELTAAWVRKHGSLDVKTRRLGEDALPAITADHANALVTPADQHDEALRSALSLSDTLIAELQAADYLLIASPVHNFTVPVALKAWVDHVVRPGASFVSTPQGKVGLLHDRPTLVAVTAGGAIFGDGALQPDFFRPYLSAILKTIGITDVEFVAMDRTTKRSDPPADARAMVRQWIDTRGTTSRQEATA